MSSSGHRVVAWMDTLTDDERIHVKRLIEQPPEMQVAFVWVDFNRQLDDLRKEHAESMPKSAIVRNLASGIGGGIVTIVGAAAAYLFGADKVVR